MRKQTKVVAVASAAALLAIGASMTSFAAAGWVEEDGVWYYYDSDGNIVEDEWKKSGDNWYWLDSEEGGAMATDKLIDDDGDYYYVDASGVMVKNTWVKVVNDEQDDDEDPAEYHYYYMQSSGKAYTAGNSESTKFKTIDGKRYAFDDDGIMLYGWVTTDSSMQNDDDGWNTTDEMYYCGSWEDGAMKTGWQYLSVWDESEDDDMNYWFYFQSNGKRFQVNENTTDNYRTKTINGKKYGFDERGVMVYQWVVQTGTASASGSASASDWQYFSSPEDGARVTKGWFKVVPPNEDNTYDADFTDSDSFDITDADDEDEHWYYAKEKGVLVTGQIKKIKGKYYGFQPDDGRECAGSMLSGLVLIKVDSEGNITDVADDGIDTDELSDLIDGVQKYDDWLEDGYKLYYFGSSSDEDTDGAMKTGSVTINLDGDSYSFYFSKSGGVEGKGAGATGVDDKKYIYKGGVRIKADSDDKYQAVKVTGENGVDIGASGVTVTKIDSSDLRNKENTSLFNETDSYTNSNGDTLRYVTTGGKGYYLVNSSGTIQKSKTAAKDGNDWYFYVYDSEIKMYTSEKKLTPKDDNYSGLDLTNWKNF
ncbi:MAG: hypothetical protein LUC94_10460 [Clostridiales bacterium]|nr:hypothetical protein [Clostridiales bacterium]